MLAQLEKEAAEDEEIYDKMACWCETNDKAKTKSIAEAEARIGELTTKRMRRSMTRWLAGARPTTRRRRSPLRRPRPAS